MSDTPTITIYSTHTCPFCKMEKAFLEGKGVSYNNIFVDDDDNQRDTMVELTGQRGVPVTMLHYADGEKRCFIGFQQEMLESALKGEKVGEVVGNG